jgi:uncharacterized protein YqjF (DUF2071 family)
MSATAPAGSRIFDSHPAAGTKLITTGKEAAADRPPSRAVFLSAEWKNLAALNWRVDPSLLRRHRPAGTELDYFDGATFVSVVAFQFLRTRLLGWPIPFHVNFPEMNLRFYVKRQAPEGWRRGVVFIKEIVPRRAIAWVANTFYSENYEAIPMTGKVRTSLAEGGPILSAIYSWKLGQKWGQLAMTGRGVPAFPETGSEAEFIFEHYWGYAAKNRVMSVEYQVDHPRWRVWSDAALELEAEFSRLYGAEFAASLDSPPSSILLAEGSPILVRRPSMIKAQQSNL